jgi:hypothetical protein
LIDNISTTKKWPTRTKNKKMSKSGIIEYRNAEDHFSNAEPVDDPPSNIRIHATYSKEK